MCIDTYRYICMVRLGLRLREWEVNCWSLGAPKKNISGLSPHRIKDTLPETNMETQKRPQKDYSASKMGLYGFPC